VVAGGFEDTGSRVAPGEARRRRRSPKGISRWSSVVKRFSRFTPCALHDIATSTRYSSGRSGLGRPFAEYTSPSTPTTGRSTISRGSPASPSTSGKNVSSRSAITACDADAADVRSCAVLDIAVPYVSNPRIVVMPKSRIAMATSTSRIVKPDRACACFTGPSPRGTSPR
jgi:hypothetical protein